MKQIFLFILFSFVWITGSERVWSQESFEIDEERNIVNEESLKFPLEAVVVSRLAQLRVEASDQARLLVLLRQGDKLELLESKNSYFKARYLLENQFPVEGWILADQLQIFQDGNLIKINKPKEQAYKAPTNRDKAQTKVEDFPEVELKENIELPKNPLTNSSNLEVQASNQETSSKKPSPKRRGAWAWTSSLGLGWSRYEESLSTKINGKEAEGSFLDYQLDGLKISLALGAFRDFNQFSGGIRGRYAFSFYNSSVSAANFNIESADVLAQFHQANLEAYGFRAWTFKKFEFEPELAIGPQFQFFSVNQLRERKLAHPVLFSDMAVFLNTNLKPKLHTPYNLVLEPYLALIFFYYFVEGPIQRTKDGDIRTGRPSITTFLFHYGLNLAWEMKQLGLEDHWLRLSYLVEDYSRAFSGEGNRAGLKTEDVKSKLKLQSFSLAYEYRF